MTYYVEVIGSYDAVRVGPFDSEPAAAAYAAAIPSARFTANVLSAADAAASDAAYGALPVQPPGDA